MSDKMKLLGLSIFFINLSSCANFGEFVPKVDYSTLPNNEISEILKLDLDDDIRPRKKENQNSPKTTQEIKNRMLKKLTTQYSPNELKQVAISMGMNCSNDDNTCEYKESFRSKLYVNYGLFNSKWGDTISIFTYRIRLNYVQGVETLDIKWIVNFSNGWTNKEI